MYLSTPLCVNSRPYRAFPPEITTFRCCTRFFPASRLSHDTTPLPTPPLHKRFHLAHGVWGSNAVSSTNLFDSTVILLDIHPPGSHFHTALTFLLLLTSSLSLSLLSFLPLFHPLPFLSFLPLFHPLPLLSFLPLFYLLSSSTSYLSTFHPYFISHTEDHSLFHFAHGVSPSI